MARVPTVAWLSVLVGSILASAEGFAAPPEAEAPPPSTAGQARPSRTQVALSTAIDNYRRGEYEAAADLFRQAQAGSDDLTAAQRRDLDYWLKLNTTALQGRREGAERLKKAEEAVRAGRTQEAAGLLKVVQDDQQFLKAADKQRAQLLAEQLRPGVKTTVQQAGPGSKAALPLARTKVQQARMLMTHGNFDAAEALAHEAEHLNAAYTPDEDTPRKVLDDVAKARSRAIDPTDSHALLTAARTALDHGDLDTAELLAHQAEKAGSSWTSSLRPWGDSPSKVLRDVQAARAKVAVSQVPAKVAPTEPVRTVSHTTTSTTSPRETHEQFPADPRVCLRQAKEQLDAGNFDEAEKLAHQAGLGWQSHWSILEYSPDKVMTDIQKARARRDQEDSVRVLAEARKQYEMGNLDEAEKLAHQAERLHGPYGFLDLGDRPQKLCAEIAALRAKSGTAKMATDVAKTDGDKGKATSPTAPDKSKPSPTSEIARSALEKSKPSSPEVARTTPEKSWSTSAPGRLGGDGSSQATADVRKPMEKPAVTKPATANVSGAVKDKAQGLVLLQQAQQELRKGDTVKARRLAEEVYTSPYGLEDEADLVLRAIDREEFNRRSATAKGTAPAKPAGQQVVVSAAAHEQGEALLKQAREALGKNQIAAARRLAEQAYTGKFGVEDEADRLLRALDTADFSQRALTANRAYENGMNALQRGDYAQVKTIFTAIDVKALQPDQQARVKEILEACAAPQPGAAKPAAQQAVAKTPTPPAAQPTVAKVTTPPAAPTTPARVEASKPKANDAEAVQTLAQARKALEAGDAAKAKQLAAQAASMKSDFNWWEDNPEKVLADVRRAEAAKQPAGSAKPQAVADAADPRSLLRQARDLYGAGKLDEAEKVAQRASVSKTVRWGLFEDSPEKLLGEIRKSRAKQEQDESVRVLADARQAFEKGNLDEAERLTYRAEHLHGPYTVWEMGDKPQKLRAEIEDARTKSKPPKLPPAPTTEVARTAPEKTPFVVPDSTKPVTPAPTMAAAPPPSWPATPPAVSTTSAAPTPVPTLPASPVVDPAKQAAQRLVAEARQLQRENRLIEARQKALEAQKTGATFTAEEDRPEVVLLSLSAQCEKQVEGLVRQSGTTAGNSADPNRYQRAESELLQARQLAEGFRFDTQPIDDRLNAVRRARDQALVAMAPPPVPGMVQQVQHTEPAAPATARPAETGTARAESFAVPSADTPQQRGQSLLAQARLELRKGETGNARRLAEEVYAGPYGLQGEAEKVIRSIDVEEYNQRTLVASRSFDAGTSAYARKDYTQAAAIFRTVDPHLLKPEKQARLKELMLTPELQPRALAQADHRVPVAGANGDTGTARATDSTSAKATTPEASFAQQVKAMQEVKFQQLREDGLRAQRDATDRFKAGNTDQALEILQDYLGTLRDAQLDPDRVTMLKKPVEARLAQFKTLKAQRDFERMQVSQHETAESKLRNIELQEENKKKQVAELMKKYNALFKEGKYDEAEMYAMKAHELDPDNAAAGAAIYVARTQKNQVAYDNTKRQKEDYFVKALDSAETTGPYVGDDPLAIDPKINAIAKQRKGTDSFRINIKSEKEREIERRLLRPYTFDFKDEPLQQVIEDLHDMTGINFYPDTAALQEEGISLSRPVTLRVEQLSLKSALTLLLKQVHLRYVIQEDVLQITTEANARGRLEQRIHGVADLIIPVENGMAPTNLMQTVMSQGEASNLRLNGATPYLGTNSLPNGTPAGGNAQLMNTTSVNGTTVTKHGPQQTIQEVLIKLITNSIAPQSWSDMGGQGTIEYFPLGMALVINQTPDIQEQIAELLAALRRLQDQEVSVEVRFITMSESFFERIGVDFNINIKTDKYTTKYEPQIVSQQFKPFGYVNDFNPKDLVIGLTPGNTFTQNLDIPVTTSSFNQAIPPFGAFPGIPGGNGGLSMGLAFLSDIQVFLFMEAAQGDQRTNVMQAPKLTLFNGQTATITVTDQQFFVTNVQVVQAGGQVVFVPQNNLLPTGGVTMTVQAVISADRRFVRLNITPNITNITTAVVQLFPITTFITPIFEGGAVGQPIPFTQFLQQPVFNTINLQTTVVVPDGGTVLMGGLKRLSEGRNEFGPPILSKIPIINRLFKNTGYGRETESLLIMVTPRIIINEEEETRQTGVGTGTTGVGGPLNEPGQQGP